MVIFTYVQALSHPEAVCSCMCHLLLFHRLLRHANDVHEVENRIS